MSGRLNPREYDLGELRDAVRHSHRRGLGSERTDVESGDGVESDSDDAEPVEQTDTGSVEQTDTGSNRSRFDGDRPVGRGRDGPVDRPGRQSTPKQERSLEDRTVSNRDLELLGQLSRGDIERPYLSRLPDEYSAQVEIFEWLEALLDTAGLDGALDALAYYESIGWLSERSHEHLVDFLDGLSGTDGADTRSLTVEDHRRSLVYVARLAHRLY